MRRQSKILYILSLALFSLPLFAWKEISNGVQYQDIAPHYINDWSHIHVFKINLKQYQLKLINHDTLKKKMPSIQDYAEYTKAPLVFNAGFFDQKNQPLGLRISEFKISHHFKPISWWGVFYIKNQEAHIQSAHAYQHNQHTEFAIQAGPRLLVAHQIPHFRPGYAERTALCVLSKNEIAVIMSQFFPMTLEQLAQIVQHPPLNCQTALNLDGGSSTQFYANFPHFFLQMPGLASVSDVISIESRISP